MRYYVPQDGTWTEAASDAVDPPYVEITEDPPTVHFVGETNTSFQLSGAPARSDTETVHTVAIVDSSLTDGTTLCALRVEGDDLTVEDRRPADARTQYADAFDQLQSALDEILIPVYIDDALQEIEDTIDGLLVLHTVRYNDGRDAPPTYVRVAIFQDGNLVLETEHGSF